MSNTTPILSVRDLKVYYPLRSSFLSRTPKQTLKAVDGVSFDLYPGEVLGLVGESGCGKSSLGRAIMRLNSVTQGEIKLQGQDFMALQGETLRHFRPNIQMVFQDPYASLDPRMTVYEALREPLAAHRLSTGEAEIEKKIRKVIDIVGLTQKAIKKYPHEFSGGQRQRICIARALILDPKVIVADEPVSSLDVSVQAQILNLLKTIQKELSLSMIFISHNLAVVKYISDRIAVMYLGKIVETATCEMLYKTPLHPYTQALVSAVPIPDPRLERARKRIDLTGELPSPVNPPSGCAFHTRCPIAVASCKQADRVPVLQAYKENTHQVSCFEVK